MTPIDYLAVVGIVTLFAALAAGIGAVAWALTNKRVRTAPAQGVPTAVEHLALQHDHDELWDELVLVRASLTDVDADRADYKRIIAEVNVLLKPKGEIIEVGIRGASAKLRKRTPGDDLSGA